jgi:hypothetical protein
MGSVSGSLAARSLKNLPTTSRRVFSRCLKKFDRFATQSAKWQVFVIVVGPRTARRFSMKLDRSTLSVLTAIFFASLSSAGTSFAAPPQLKGQYAFTGEASCLGSTTVSQGTPVSPSGFNSKLKVVGDSFVVSYSVQGVRTFNGDGTGKVEATTVDLSYDNGTPSASSQTFTFLFTYVVNADGTFTSDIVSNSYVGTFVAGPRTGQTVTVDNFELDGIASVNNMTLTIATPRPIIETHTFSNGDVQQRICHRSRVATWLGN